MPCQAAVVLAVDGERDETFSNESDDWKATTDVTIIARSDQ
jgi:hypothetical protein